jgi:Domain of unknown function (DUF4276)
MRKLHILAEGQTEEVVVNNVIKPYLSHKDLCVTTSILKTKRPAGGPTFKGGITSWEKIAREIRLLLGDTSTTLLTTLVDYYGFPGDAPGMETRPRGSPYDRVEHVERAIAEAVDSGRFLPHLVLHEIEAWVLSDCERLGNLMEDPSGVTQLAREVESEPSPETVNDGTETAPSKRIIRVYPQYVKTFDGPLIIADTGLDSIRQCCPHADRWLANVQAALKK